MRTFMAILLSDALRDSLAEMSSDLGQCGGNVKWVGKDNFHITLFFFGDLEPDVCNGIVRAMPEMVSDLAPFYLSLGKMGGFPSLRRPRVLWAGVNKGSREIIQVHTNVLSVIEPLGFTEDKKWDPHVTLGRVKSPGELGSTITAIEEFNRSGGAFGEYLIPGISLMESTLTPKGAVYSELAFAKFQQ